MKIVHIITSLKRGGAESLLVDFLAHPLSAKAEHTVIFFHDGPNRTRLEELGITCYPIKGAFCLYDPLFFLRLYMLVKKLRPACIHSWLWSANIASRIVGTLLRIPVLNSFHLGVDQDGFFRNCFDRLTHHMPDRLIAVSQGVSDSLTTKFSIYKPAERLKVIKNGIDVQNIIAQSQKNSIDRRMLGLDEHHFVIGSVGRWIVRKNYSFLVDVFAQLVHRHATMRLVLVGVGQQKELLQQRIAYHAIESKVVLVEGQPALGYYPTMDCFVQTSFKEGISIALLEAMSCSLPCVLTEPSGAHEVIVHDYNGLLVPSYEINAVAAALEQLFFNKTLVTMLGNNAVKTMHDNFGLAPMIDSYYREYEILMNNDSDYLNL